MKDPKIVVITGASAGVGRAVARRFAGDKAYIGLLARDLQRLRDAQREVEAEGARACICPVDIANAEEVYAAARTIEEQLGPIDIWINNAMVTVVSEVKDMEAEEYKRVTDVCYLGYVYGTLAALKYMWPRNHGVIVQVGSALAYRSIPLQSAYCGAKHAVEGFTESLRSELLHNKKNIHVTMVQMPALNTPQFNWCKTRMPRHPQPVPPIYQPEVAADAVYWSAHHRRREIIVGGKNLLIVWANKFMPGFGDRYLARTGYASQQTDKVIEGRREDNLWHPVPGAFAARGDFSDRSKDESWGFLLVAHRRWFALAVLVLLGIYFVLCRT